MSEVQKTIDNMRLKADFLARHRDVLDRYSYETGLQVWRANYASRAHSQERTGEGPEPWRPGEWDWPRGGESNDIDYISVNAYYSCVEFTVSGPNAKDIVRTLRRAIGGLWEKAPVGEMFKIKQPLTKDADWPLVTIEVARDAVCVPKVVGKKKVTIKAVEAREAQPERVEYVDEIEYDCGNLLEGAEVLDG